MYGWPNSNNQFPDRLVNSVSFENKQKYRRKIPCLNETEHSQTSSRRLLQVINPELDDSFPTANDDSFTIHAVDKLQKRQLIGNTMTNCTYIKEEREEISIEVQLLESESVLPIFPEVRNFNTSIVCEGEFPQIIVASASLHTSRADEEEDAMLGEEIDTSGGGGGRDECRHYHYSSPLEYTYKDSEYFDNNLNRRQQHQQPQTRKAYYNPHHHRSSAQSIARNSIEPENMFVGGKVRCRSPSPIDDIGNKANCKDDNNSIRHRHHRHHSAPLGNTREDSGYFNNNLNRQQQQQPPDQNAHHNSHYHYSSAQSISRNRIEQKNMFVGRRIRSRSPSPTGVTSNRASHKDNNNSLYPTSYHHTGMGEATISRARSTANEEEFFDNLVDTFSSITLNTNINTKMARPNDYQTTTDVTIFCDQLDDVSDLDMDNGNELANVERSMCTAFSAANGITYLDNLVNAFTGITIENTIINTPKTARSNSGFTTSSPSLKTLMDDIDVMTGYTEKDCKADKLTLNNNGGVYDRKDAKMAIDVIIPSYQSDDVSDLDMNKYFGSVFAVEVKVKQVDESSITWHMQDGRGKKQHISSEHEWGEVRSSELLSQNEKKGGINPSKNFQSPFLVNARSTSLMDDDRSDSLDLFESFFSVRNEGGIEAKMEHDYPFEGTGCRKPMISRSDIAGDMTVFVGKHSSSDTLNFDDNDYEGHKENSQQLLRPENNIERMMNLSPISTLPKIQHRTNEHRMNLSNIDIDEYYQLQLDSTTHSAGAISPLLRRIPKE